MFVDQAKIYVKAGDGGNGMVAFRREKFVPDGGPAGGDGGKGGNVVFYVDEGLNTLMDFRYQRHFKADRGENGMSKGMHGRGAEDLQVAVPPGTLIKDLTTQRLIADLTEEGESAVIAEGGRGGRGNIRFAGPRNPAPSIAENGEPGEEIEVELELKVLADVGLVGFPSVGKSTLLAAVSAAKPKIADYPFTTLSPNLGIVDAKDGRHFAVADMPGIIEGAAEGVGLGLDFLRHIERTKVLLHVLDMSGLIGRDPFEDYVTILDEMRQYDDKLLERPQVIVANKMDMPDSEVALELFKKQAEEAELELPEIYEVSAVAHKGLQPLIMRTADLLDLEKERAEKEALEEKRSDDHVVYTLEEESKEGAAPFEIGRDEEADAWVVYGEEIEKLFAMTNFDHDEAVMRFSRQMRGMGIDEALRQVGATNGDLVRIDDFFFEFVE